MSTIMNDAHAQLEPLLSVQDLADYLGMHPQGIYDLRKTGRGPRASRVGRELRFRTSDVRQWLDAITEPEPNDEDARARSGSRDGSA